MIPVLLLPQLPHNTHTHTLFISLFSPLMLYLYLSVLLDTATHKACTTATNTHTVHINSCLYCAITDCCSNGYLSKNLQIALEETEDQHNVVTLKDLTYLYNMEDQEHTHTLTHTHIHPHQVRVKSSQQVRVESHLFNRM